MKWALLVCSLFLLSGAKMSGLPLTIDEQFGVWSIPKRLFDFILQIVPEGGTILEMGSGWASGQLSKHYTVYSVEHKQEWMNLYDTHYIFAPIVNGFYDPEILKRELPEFYDLILIDGPGSDIGRYGFFTNLHLFNTNIPILVDDTHRPDEQRLVRDLCRKLGRSPQLYKEYNKSFTLIR